jgi:ammonium transporter, Amt family
MALPDGALRPAFQRRIWSAALLVFMFVLSILVTTLPYGRDEEIVGSDEALAELDTGDTAWMIVATGLVLFMTPGVSVAVGSRNCAVAP